MSKTCILVSPYFPPSSLAGVHRARHLATHLPAAGWTPVVVCVHERFHEQRLDASLATLVPAATEVVKVGAIPQRITRPLGLGEISLRAFAGLRRAIFELLAARRIDAVFITGSPYYPMLLSAPIRRRFGVPVVLDFQDPWVSAWGAAQPRWSKPGISHALATLLEPRALRGASFVTSVSERQNQELALRHPWFDAAKMAALPIGADSEEFRALGRMAGGAAPDFEPGRVHLSYVGTIWPLVLPALRVLLGALARLKRDSPRLYARLRLHFVGTTADPDDTRGFRVRPLADGLGVGDAVDEIPQRIPYLEALAILRRSDGTLIIGSDEPHYTASKIFPYLMSGKPYLSVLHEASSAHAILTAAGGGLTLSFASRAALEAMEGELASGLARLASSPHSLGRADAAVYGAYEARAIAQRYARIFDSLGDAEARR